MFPSLGEGRRSWFPEETRRGPLAARRARYFRTTMICASGGTMEAKSRKSPATTTRLKRSAASPISSGCNGGRRRGEVSRGDGLRRVGTEMGEGYKGGVGGGGRAAGHHVIVIRFSGTASGSARVGLLLWLVRWGRSAICWVQNHEHTALRPPCRSRIRFIYERTPRSRLARDPDQYRHQHLDGEFRDQQRSDEGDG